MCTAALLLAAAAPGWAQHGGGATWHPSVGATGAPARPIVGPQGGPFVHAMGRIGTPLHPNFAPIHGVPGMGFDYEHLVAVSRMVRDRSGRERRMAVVPFITPIFSDGLPYYYGFDTGIPYYSDTQPEQPPLVVPQAPVIVQAPPPAQEPAPAPQASAPAPPLPEVGQFILVRRDGQVTLAVAFTTTGGRVTYVAQDGTRRSFPLAELDRDATQQMNEVNGNTLKLPEL